MKTSFCAAAVGLLAAGFATPASCLTAQQKISALESEDFVYSVGGPEPSAPVDGFEIRGATVGNFPALDGQGVSMALVNLGPCDIGPPHVHPRATEMLYTIAGNHLRVAFIEESGGDGAVVNDLSKGDATFFPEGLIHYQQNLGCETATFLVALNSEDPGVVSITTEFFELTDEALQGSGILVDPSLQALLDSLPEAPATARLQCMESCADDGGLSYSYNSSDFE